MVNNKEQKSQKKERKPRHRNVEKKKHHESALREDKYFLDGNGTMVKHVAPPKAIKRSGKLVRLNPDFIKSILLPGFENLVPKTSNAKATLSERFALINANPSMYAKELEEIGKFRKIVAVSMGAEVKEGGFTFLGPITEWTDVTGITAQTYVLNGYVQLKNNGSNPAGLFNWATMSLLFSEFQLKRAEFILMTGCSNVSSTSTMSSTGMHVPFVMGVSTTLSAPNSFTDVNELDQVKWFSLDSDKMEEHRIETKAVGTPDLEWNAMATTADLGVVKYYCPAANGAYLNQNGPAFYYRYSPDRKSVV